MKSSAKLRYLRIAPRKVRLVADLIRGRNAVKAEQILEFTRNRSAKPILKLLLSAITSAKNNSGAAAEELYISELLVCEGPKLKRYRQRAKGQIYEIQKKSSHITLVLESKTDEDIAKGGAVAKKLKKSASKLPLANLPQNDKRKTVAAKKVLTNEKPRKPKKTRNLKRIYRRKSF